MEQKYIAGDLVRYIGVNTPRVVKIDEVREECLILELTKDNCRWCLADYSEVESIPITHEILKKNGWENTEYTPLIYTHNEHGIEFWASLKGIENGGTVTYHDEELLDIKYVHELQHILWALGLNANLKI